MNKITFIVIPAFNPSYELTKLIDKLHVMSDASIIVVNDGSTSEFDEIFQLTNEFNTVQIISHKVNKGKGAALKLAFDFILNNEQQKDSIIVTADADGQHSVSDIKKIIKFAKTLTEKFLVLGIRDLSKDIPFRSKIGNYFIDKAFKIFHGIDCKGDSQTGLRAFSGDLLEKFSNLDGDKYDYETNMLLSTKNDEADLKLIPIETIYIDHNQSSHFHPLIDSLSIIRQLFSYSLIAILTFLLEILVFAILLPISTIIQANVVARICSIIINFILVKTRVFKSKERTIVTASKFVSVALFNSVLVGILVAFMSSKLQIDNVFLFKIMLDCSLFLINFYISKQFIFKDKS